MTNLDGKIKLIGIILFILLVIPLIIFLLAIFKINPLASPIVGTWKGSIQYIDSSTDIQTDGTFIFTNDGNCTIRLNQTYWDGDEYAIKEMNMMARWDQNGDEYHLYYGNDSQLFDIENIKDNFNNKRQISLPLNTVKGKSSPFYGIIIAQ